MSLRSIPLLVIGLVLAGCSPPTPIKIGFLAGLTGSVSELGNGARKGLELALREANQAGGIGGRTLEMVVKDDKNEPAAGLAAYQEFRSEGVSAVVGPVASTVIGTILPFLNEQQILTISPTVSATSVSGLDDWFFRVITPNTEMGAVLADYALEQQLKDVAVLRETSNGAYTSPVYETFRTKMEAAGGTVRAPVEFDLRLKPDFPALAQALGKASAYLVLASGYDTAQVGQQLARLGMMQPLLCPPWAMTPDILTLGCRQVERIVFVSIYDSQSQNPGWLAFRESFQKIYGEEPGFPAVYAHDAATVLLAALKKAGSSQPEELRKAMKSLGEIQGLQSTIRLDDSGDVVRKLFLLSARDGRFIRVLP